MTGLKLLRELKPTDRVGMLLFSDKRRWVYDFAPNSSVVAAPIIDQVPAGGGTDLAAAFAAGLDRLAYVPIRDRHVVIVSEGVTISIMGIGADLYRALLERLARETGGRFYRITDPDEVPSLLFEDRKSEARPPFVQSSLPALSIGGGHVATIGGMSLYSADPNSTVLFTDALGDQLFASKEYGNRAVVFFASARGRTGTVPRPPERCLDRSWPSSFLAGWPRHGIGIRGNRRLRPGADGRVPVRTTP